MSCFINDILSSIVGNFTSDYLCTIRVLSRRTSHARPARKHGQTFNSTCLRWIKFVHKRERSGLNEMINFNLILLNNVFWLSVRKWNEKKTPKNKQTWHNFVFVPDDRYVIDLTVFCKCSWLGNVCSQIVVDSLLSVPSQFSKFRISNFQASGN